MKVLARICIVLLLLSLSACRNNSDENHTPWHLNPQCTQHQKNRAVYNLLHDSYLWYDEVLTVDYTTFSSPEELLDYVIPPQDRWSYIDKTETFNQYYDENRYQGMGLSVKFDIDNRLRVRFVYKNSPAGDAGLMRTDEILFVNDRPVSTMDNLQAFTDELYRYSTASIEWETIDNEILSAELQWDWVSITPVLLSKIIDTHTRRVGYLVFNNFFESAVSELDDEFAAFATAEIDDLILDLRYNGGGLLETAVHLGSLIAGQPASGRIFVKTQHNDKYTHTDEVAFFEDADNALGLNRVFIITTESTCSASEAVINGLKGLREDLPGFQVFLIGDNTCGKPVGMYAYEYCDLVILPIEFKITNALNDPDYFDGLTPDYPADDDLDYELGDEHEASLQAALYYIENHMWPQRQVRTRGQLPDGLQKSNQLRGLKAEMGAF